MIGRKTLKQISICFLSGVLILAGCAQAKATTPVAVTQVSTGTPSPVPTGTHTFTPTATPTASITPLPTIATYTPTFDVSTIVTITPAPNAQCPKIDSAIYPETYLPEKLEYPSANSAQLIVEYLNHGGNTEALVRRLDQIYPITEFSGGYAHHDLTGDQNDEFLYVDLYYNGKPIIFSCKDRTYNVLAILSGNYDHDFYKTDIEDLIPDGIPEIIVEGTSGVSFPVSTFYVYRWAGRAFSLLEQITFAATRQIEIKDVDGNGTKEIILIGDNPGCFSCKNFIPQRQRTVTYSWNGKNFVEVSNEFGSPEYRFQAIQDADGSTISGKFNRAIKLYKQVISDKKLEWWSPARMQYEQEIYVWFPGVTPPPIPSEDKTEYPRLASYAYYRVMLIHLIENHESDANTTYNTLQQEFNRDPYGLPYVEMATAFWEAYQTTHKMYDGCTAAIQYAVEHPEILNPLGSDYHGWQSHTYVPADVCPFR